MLCHGEEKELTRKVAKNRKGREANLRFLGVLCGFIANFAVMIFLPLRMILPIAAYNLCS